MARQISESYFCENQLQLSPDKKFIRGKFGHADLKNYNGRNYRFGLWENLLDRSSTKDHLRRRVMLGQLGHPEDVEGQIENTSHIVTQLKLQSDGVVWGEAEILPTPSGNILRILYEAGVQLGVSSRGYLPEGVNLIPEGDVLDVPDEYELVTFDFVIDPSTPGAFPTLSEAKLAEVRSIISESKKDINKEVVQFVEGLGSKRKKKTVLEQAGRPAKNKSKEDSIMKGSMRRYCDTLEQVIDEFKERLLLSESVIEQMASGQNVATGVIRNLRDRHLAAESIIENLRDRYLVAEEVIEGFRDYSLELEKTLVSVSNKLKLAEEVISDLSARYTLSEQVIEALRDDYTIIKRELASIKKSNGVASNEGIAEVTRKLRLSESVINEMADRIRAQEGKSVKSQKRRIPDGYFEGISARYGIPVSEAKRSFKRLGCNKKSFEMFMAEKKRIASRSYGEYPYMKEGKSSPVHSSVYEDNSETARIARLVENAL